MNKVKRTPAEEQHTTAVFQMRQIVICAHPGLHSLHRTLESFGGDFLMVNCYICTIHIHIHTYIDICSTVMNIIVSLLAMWYSKGKLKSCQSSYAIICFTCEPSDCITFLKMKCSKMNIFFFIKDYVG